MASAVPESRALVSTSPILGPNHGQQLDQTDSEIDIVHCHRGPSDAAQLLVGAVNLAGPQSGCRKVHTVARFSPGVAELSVDDGGPIEEIDGEHRLADIDRQYSLIGKDRR